MKCLKNSSGIILGYTMTVSELREALNQYPDDMPVFATWEGVCAYVATDDLNVEIVRKGDDSCSSLVIDVNNY